jgi:hypothetical protein
MLKQKKRPRIDWTLGEKHERKCYARLREAHLRTLCGHVDQLLLVLENRFSSEHDLAKGFVSALCCVVMIVSMISYLASAPCAVRLAAAAAVVATAAAAAMVVVVMVVHAHTL